MYKIIIIDDEEVSCRSLANVVGWADLGYTVLGAFTDGKRALEFVDHNDVDVVLTDIKMNEVSGIDIAKHINNHHSQIKVIFMSAYKDFVYAKEAIKYNVENYLTKPVSMPEIKELFRELKVQLDTTKEHDKNCCVFNISIQGYEALLSDGGYTEESLSKTVNDFFAMDKHRFINIHPILFRGKTMYFVASSDGSHTKETFELRLGEKLNNIKQGLKVVLGLEIDYTITNFFSNLLELASHSLSLGLPTLKVEELKVDPKILEPEANTHSVRNIILRAKEYIKDNLDKEISLESTAEHLYISSVYFSRLFKEQTNENFIDYVIELRMEKASYLLKDTNKKIYEICHEIGYSNVRYFYKVFKKHMGCTPTQYRDTIIGSGNER